MLPLIWILAFTAIPLITLYITGGADSLPLLALLANLMGLAALWAALRILRKPRYLLLMALGYYLSLLPVYFYGEIHRAGAVKHIAAAFFAAFYAMPGAYLCVALAFLLYKGKLPKRLL